MGVATIWAGFGELLLDVHLFLADQEEVEIRYSLDSAQMVADPSAAADSSAIASSSTYWVHCECTQYVHLQWTQYIKGPATHDEESCPVITQRLGELEGCEQGSEQGQEGAWQHVAPAVQRAVQLRQTGGRPTVSTRFDKVNSHYTLFGPDSKPIPILTAQ